VAGSLSFAFKLHVLIIAYQTSAKMDDVMKDKRFKHIARDPRFRRMKRTDRKVKIDKRFQGMFDNKEFKLKYSVDKRGRPIQSTTSENLEKYYDIASSDESVDDEEDSESKVKKKEVAKPKNKNVEDEDENEDDDEDEEEGVSDDDEPIKAKLDDEEEEDDDEEENSESDEEDLARGQGNVETSSSEDDGDDEDDEGIDHKWGELANDATKVSDATSRLALCNMDWDRIKANDILVLMNSFKPQNGTIKSVTVYPSDYGLERMKEEDQKGPIELVEKKQEEEDSVGQREKLRQYQLTRLKYYYAVIVCDTADTANSIYTGCDGLEYETSSTKIDLRFIPEDMTFDQKPKSEATSMPEASVYKPSLFKTTALNQSKVQLTWDETDKDRIAMTMRKFKEEELDEMNVKDYLASSSGSDGEGVDPYAGFEDPDFGEVEDKNSKADKLKELVKDEEEMKKEPAELQITWEAGMTSSDAVAKKKKKDGEMTPWENYLEKKKEKKKQKREEKKKPKEGDVPPEEDGDYSDDDIPEGIDMNDSYFQEELSAQNGDATKEKKKGKSKKKKKKTDAQKTNEEKEQEAQLAMLMMDEEDGKEHFNLAAIQSKEAAAGKVKKGKKKRKKLQQQEEAAAKDTQDSFKFNVEDNRFTDIYQNPLFNIDPSAPEYKKTQAMDTLVQEKFKRRKKNKNKDSGTPSKKPKLDTSNSGIHDPSLASLVKSVKAKTKTLQEKKKKKKLK